MAGSSGVVGGVVTNIGGLQQGDRLKGMGEAPGAVVAANGGQEAAECSVKRYFSSNKGSAL